MSLGEAHFKGVNSMKIQGQNSQPPKPDLAGREKEKGPGLRPNPAPSSQERHIYVDRDNLARGEKSHEKPFCAPLI